MNPSDFYDVIVAGGGFSGVAAAIAAAREGMSVLLIEKSNCLGGAAANCLVNPFMPYWTKINEKKVNLCQGIFLEICEELQKNDGIHKNGMEFDEEILKLVLNRMVLKAGVRLLFHSCLADAEIRNKFAALPCSTNPDGRHIAPTALSTPPAMQT